MDSLTFKLPLFALVSTLLPALSACSDQELGGPGADSRVIRFDVATATDEAAASRSGSRKSTCGEAIAMTSGAETLYLTPEVREGIHQSAVSSRSSVVTTETIENIGVYAGLVSNGATYMENVEVTRENLWSPEREYLWPGKDALHITAYSPYSDATELNSNSEPVISYQTPAEVADQVSLLWAEPVEASASPCALHFHNALTGIRVIAGGELAPCTVREIRLNGIPSAGTLNAATGEWSSVSTPASFAVEPEITVNAASGSAYVAPGTPLMAADETFLMIPGELPDGAEIALTLEFNGESRNFTASLAGATWKAGTTVTYRLSAKPDASGLTLEVIGKLETEYPGQTVPFLVRSALVSAAGDSTEVAWKAEFIDDDGNTLDERPDWILTFPQEGSGHNDLKASTRLQDLEYIKLSPESQTLQNTPDINLTSGNTPYNLANSTGAAQDQNTANCYIINAPGEYSFPLVYGNAIKNGADNKEAYTSTSHNSMALKTFVNHLGAPITSPYIYNNAGCTPADAYLVWEGRLDLIRNVALSADGQRVTFSISAKNIRQGNAMIAVRDKTGEIMWSWNIWVTDYRPESDMVSYTDGSGLEHKFYTRNIGRIMGGDITKFPHCATKVRFTQTDVPDGMEPLSTVVDFTQTGITVETADYYNFYQWGRKDPIKSSLKEWFNAEHYELKSIRVEYLPTISSGENHIPAFIKNPDVFFLADHSQSFFFSNLWNSSLNSKDNVKTIYDPSPAGAKVPLDNGLSAIIKDTSVTKSYGAAATGSGAMGLYLTFASGTQMFLPELGYRSGSSGSDASGIGTLGTLWLAQTPAQASTAKTDARCIVVQQAQMQQNTNPRTHGFGVRPVME